MDKELLVHAAKTVIRLSQMTFLTFGLLNATQPVQAQGVTPGNVVVFRAGSGVNTLGNTGNNVFLDEYTPLGALVKSIEINSTGTGTKLVTVGNGTAEGGLTISADGKWIGFAGYNSTIPAASSLSGATSASVPRVAGILNTTTGSVSLTETGTFFSGGAIRSAASPDGEKIFAVGGNTGLVYGTTEGGFSVINSTTTNNRYLGMFGGDLFVSGGSNGAPTVGLYTGNPLQTGTASGLIAQPGIPVIPTSPVSSRYGFVYLDLKSEIAGLDTMYVADDSLTDGGVTKYLLGSNGTWTQAGQLVGSRTTPSSNFRGLTAAVNGSNVTLFGTVLSTNASGGGISQLFSFVDVGAATSTLTGTTSSLTILATSGANQVFRDVVYVVPEPSTVTLAGIGLAVGGMLLRRRAAGR